MKTALTIAGSDCSGGAGIQADLKTFSALGVFGMSVVASVVAENTVRVIGITDMPPKAVGEQLDAVFEDIPPHAVKIGMLSNPGIMRTVSQKLAAYAPAHVVVDPVMYAKNGSPLLEEGAVNALIAEILPFAEVFTPNLPEAARIAGFAVESLADMYAAAERICALGCRNTLVKGGHRSGDAVDVLFDGSRFREYAAPRIDTKNTHGTGCTLSAAIAAQLALGKAVPDAVGLAKEYVTGAIRHALTLGGGCGPTHHFYALYAKAGIREEP